MKLKNNFEISCNVNQVKAYIKTLEALGYTIYSKNGYMGTWDHLTTTRSGEIQFGYKQNTGRKHFNLFGDFLVWHFTPEKSESEKELDSLQQKMSELQAQMDKLKEAVNKGKSV